MSKTISKPQRYTPENPCPICDGDPSALLRDMESVVSDMRRKAAGRPIARMKNTLAECSLTRGSRPMFTASRGNVVPFTSRSPHRPAGTAEKSPRLFGSCRLRLHPPNRHSIPTQGGPANNNRKSNTFQPNWWGKPNRLRTGQINPAIDISGLSRPQ